jgi:hypothetical protein
MLGMRYEAGGWGGGKWRCPSAALLRIKVCANVRGCPRVCVLHFTCFYFIHTNLRFCGSRCGQTFEAPWTLASRSSSTLLTSLLWLSNRSLPPSLPPLSLPTPPSRCARTSHVFGARRDRREKGTQRPRDTCAKRHACQEPHASLQVSLPYPVPLFLPLHRRCLTSFCLLLLPTQDAPQHENTEHET